MDVSQMQTGIKIGIGVAFVPPVVASTLVLARVIFLDVISNIVIRIFTLNKYNVDSSRVDYLLNPTSIMQLSKVTVIVGGAIAGLSILAAIITAIHKRCFS